MPVLSTVHIYPSLYLTGCDSPEHRKPRSACTSTTSYPSSSSTSSTSSHLHCQGEGHQSVQLNLKTHPTETRTCAGAHSQQPGTALPDWPGPLLFLHVWLGAGGKPLPKTIIGLTKGTMGRQFMTNKERSSLPSKKKTMAANGRK